MLQIELCRGKTSNNMDRIDTKQLKDGGTVLNQIQVKQTGYSKKIRGTDSNKSHSQHLFCKFLAVDHIGSSERAKNLLAL